MEGLVAIFVNSSKLSGSDIVYGVLYRPDHSDERYRTVPLCGLEFRYPHVLVTSTATAPTVCNPMDVISFHIKSTHARNVPDKENYLAIEAEAIHAIRREGS